MNRDTLFKELEKITNLPTLPAVMNRLNAAVSDPNADAQHIAAVIKDDPAMMARILKTVNSAAFSSSEQVVSLQQAVARMGLRGVQNIALSTAVFETFEDKDGAEFSREEFWRHSVCVGFAVNILYQHTMANLSARYPRDILHLAGLLHDIGKIIFENFYHADFMKALELAGTGSMPLFQAERAIFGTDHAEVGEWLARRWNLAPEVAESISHHHEPEEADEKHRDLVRLVHTANYICNLEKIGNSGDNQTPVFILGVWKRLGLKVRDIRDIVRQVIEESKHSETLLSFMH